MLSTLGTVSLGAGPEHNYAFRIDTSEPLWAEAILSELQLLLVINSYFRLFRRALFDALFGFSHVRLGTELSPLRPFRAGLSVDRHEPCLTASVSGTLFGH